MMIDSTPPRAGTAPAAASCLRTTRTYDRIASAYDLLDGIYEHSWKRGAALLVLEHAAPAACARAGG